MQLHIAEAFFIPVEREIRQAGGCGLPASWLSIEKPVSGQVHVLRTTPLLVAYFDGTQEPLNWYNPNTPSEVLHPTDLVEVLVLGETKDEKFSSMLKLVRFCAYNLQRARTDGSKTSRIEVFKSLFDDIELKELFAEYILNTTQDKVIKPKYLKILLEYDITSKTFDNELRGIKKEPQGNEDNNISTHEVEEFNYYIPPENNVNPDHYNTEFPLFDHLITPESYKSAKDVFDRIKSLHPSLMLFSEACKILLNKSKSDEKRLINIFIKALVKHKDSSDAEIITTIQKLIKFLESE